MATCSCSSARNSGVARLVALTFDDGPGTWTPAILDLLRAHGARATFFVTGRSIAGREDALRQAVADGHEVGNHGWSHSHPADLPDAALRDELERTSAEIERVAGVRPRFTRPPYGEQPERFPAAVLWTVYPGDWHRPPADVIVERVLSALHPGAIVLLHDGFRLGPSGPTVDAVAALLPALAERGYRSAVISELAEAVPDSPAFASAS